MKQFAIPDDVLRDAYLTVAKEARCFREKFAARTELIEQVRYLCGPSYAHVPIDAIRDRIIVCCKSPNKHGGGWAGTINGHGPGKVATKPKWYTKYLNSKWWGSRKLMFLKFWNYRCCICRSDKHVEVHHNNYNNLYRESMNDCVVLCRKCHKRHHRYMEALPTVMPRLRCGRP